MDDKKINDGGQAFPVQSWEYDGQGNVLQYQINGMTLRDYFAAKALAEIVSANYRDKLGFKETKVAADAYRYADAMIEVRDGK